MKKVTSSVDYSGGFIENINLVAEHIRQVDDSIYDDVNRLVFTAMEWATAPYGVEPEPILHPGEYSSEHYSIDSNNFSIASSTSAAESAASAALALISEDNSESNVWKAQAQVLTAVSYATLYISGIGGPAEYVVVYTSNGDGTFTETRQVGVYSAKWHEMEAMVNAGISFDAAGTSEAGARNSDAWANTPGNTDVPDWEWDSVNDTLTETPIVGARSAFHWKEQAMLIASGLKLVGVWDLVDCIAPPTPTPEPGELANGFFYIIGTVSGDQSGCTEWSSGDWLVWYGDLAGDTAVEGSWGFVNKTSAWNSITGVTVNGSPTATGQDLLPTTGGTMTDNLTVGDGNTGNAITVRTHHTSNGKYELRRPDDSIVGLFQYVVSGNYLSLTKRDATGVVDVTSLKLTDDGNVSVDGDTPTSDDNLTRKDYVDGINATQDTAIALNTAKVGITTTQASDIVANNAKLTGADRVLQTAYDSKQGTQDSAIALNTAKVSYKDTMTFDGTTLAITIG